MLLRDNFTEDQIKWLYNEIGKSSPNSRRIEMGFIGKESNRFSSLYGYLGIELEYYAKMNEDNDLNNDDIKLLQRFLDATGYKEPELNPFTGKPMSNKIKPEQTTNADENTPEYILCQEKEPTITLTVPYLTKAIFLNFKAADKASDEISRMNKLLEDRTKDWMNSNMCNKKLTTKIEELEHILLLRDKSLEIMSANLNATLNENTRQNQDIHGLKKELSETVELFQKQIHGLNQIIEGKNKEINELKIAQHEAKGFNFQQIIHNQEATIIEQNKKIYDMRLQIEGLSNQKRIAVNISNEKDMKIKYFKKEIEARNVVIDELISKNEEMEKISYLLAIKTKSGLILDRKSCDEIQEKLFNTNEEIVKLRSQVETLTESNIIKGKIIDELNLKLNKTNLELKNLNENYKNNYAKEINKHEITIISLESVIKSLTRDIEDRDNTIQQLDKQNNKQELSLDDKFNAVWTNVDIKEGLELKQKIDALESKLRVKDDTINELNDKISELLQIKKLNEKLGASIQNIYRNMQTEELNKQEASVSENTTTWECKACGAKGSVDRLIVFGNKVNKDGLRHYVNQMHWHLSPKCNSSPIICSVCR
jgi:chromosome segregation ATPase